MNVTEIPENEELAVRVAEMRCDPAWEQATEGEMYAWARVELYGTEAERSAQAKRFADYLATL